MLLVFGVMALNAQMKSQIGLGLDLGGNQKYELDGGGESDWDVKMGISVFAELLNPINQQFAIGGGVEYQLPRQLDGDFYGDPKFNFVPIYAIAHYNFSLTPKQTPFGVVHVGYNLYMGNDDYSGDIDLKGGLYYALGGGYIHNNLVFKAMYKVNTGSYEIEGYVYDGWDEYYDTFDVDVTNTQFNISVGMMF